jgi:hypothetical protein
MVVQIITVFHNRWIDYYYLVGEIDIYNTDAKGRKTKQFSLIYDTAVYVILEIKYERNSILIDFRVI